MARRAANGAKFDRLCNGDWQSDYASQSEADFALLSIIAYYTKDNEQVRRLFRYSALGKRDKAVRNDKYLNYALSKIRAKEPGPVDLEAIKAKAEEMARPSPIASPIASHEATASSISFPPGLVGELAQYIYDTAHLPVPEVALVAALGFVAGITGRQFNTYTGAGLNLYLTLIGATGIGKEGGKLGINRVIKRVRQQVPSVTNFIGPTGFASGQALMNRLGEQPCFYSVLGEFGYLLKRLTHPKASNADHALMQALLNLYSSSGEHGLSGEIVYSDKEKNIPLVDSPSFTIISESTPGIFYDCLDSGLTAVGYVSRFLIVEYTGDRPDRNKETATCPPHDSLVTQVANLATIALTLEQRKTVLPVQPDTAAAASLDAFDEECTSLIRGGTEERREIWGRAHLNALKVASVIAVGVNPHQPVVTEDHARWAIEFVRRSVTTVSSRFDKGEVGGGDGVKAEAAIRSAVMAFLKMTPEQRETYKTPKPLLNDRIIPLSYLREKLKRVQPFKDDRRILDETLKTLVDAGMLEQLPPQQVREKFHLSTKAYGVGQSW